jgi:hypothetical protein
MTFMPLAGPFVREAIAEHDQASGRVLLEHRYDPRMEVTVVSLVYSGGGGLPVLRFNHFDRLGSVVATSTMPAPTVANQLSNGTLASIQPGLVPPLPIGAKGVDRDHGLLRRDGDNLELTIIQQPLQVHPARLALATFDHAREFDPRDRR